MEVWTLSYQATKEKSKSDQQEPSYSQNKKSDSVITLAISSIALKTCLYIARTKGPTTGPERFFSKFLWEGGFKAAAIVRAPCHNFSSCSDSVGLVMIYIYASKQLDKHPIEVSTQNIDPSWRYWPVLVAKVMATDRPNFSNIEICCLRLNWVTKCCFEWWGMNPEYKGFQMSLRLCKSVNVAPCYGQNSGNFAQK